MLASTGEAEQPQVPVGISEAGGGWIRLMPLWLFVHLDEETYAGYPIVLQMLIEFCQMATCKEQGHVLIGY